MNATAVPPTHRCDDSCRRRSGRLFVDCIGCGRRETWRVDHLGEVTDEQATDHFTALGWNVLPTLCPGCMAKGGA